MSEENRKLARRLKDEGWDKNREDVQLGLSVMQLQATAQRYCWL